MQFGRLETKQGRCECDRGTAQMVWLFHSEVEGYRNAQGGLRMMRVVAV